MTFADRRRLEGHPGRLGLPFPFLADPHRALYHRFGLGRGRFRRVYGLGTLRAYAALALRGWRLRRSALGSGEDTLQLGGDFVIGPDGRLAAGYRPDGPDDRPAIDDLVAAVRAAADPS